MVNYIMDRYNDLRTSVRKNVLANGQSYIWYLSMVSLCLITYVIYSYVDNNTVSVKSLYALAVMITANAYIINTMENYPSGDSGSAPAAGDTSD